MPPRNAPKAESSTARKKLAVDAVTSVEDEFVEDGLMPNISRIIIDDAAQVLKRGGYEPFFMKTDAEARLRWLTEHAADRKKISRKQHLALIVNAYALFALSHQDLKIAVKQLAVERRRVIDSRTSMLRLFVEAFVSYGTEEDDARRANHSYSRDVAAIRTLIKRKVLPSNVMNLATGSGEGLDAWARANARPKRQVQPTSTAKPATISEPPAKARGKSLSKGDPVQEPEGKPTCHIEMPHLPQKLSWTLLVQNGDTTMRELDFMGSPEADDILLRCYDELRTLKALQPKPTAPRRVSKRKLVTLKIDPQLPARSLKKSAR